MNSQPSRPPLVYMHELTSCTALCGGYEGCKQHCRCRESAQGVTITMTCLVTMRHMWQVRTLSGLILESDRQTMTPYLLRMKLCAYFTFASLSPHLLLQALVKVPLRRPHLADSLKTPRTDRQGFVDLAAFLGWLWKLTVVPERYCRDMCMWLMDKLATLQMEDAMQTGHHITPYIPTFLTQLLGHSLACLLTHS